MTRQPHTNCRVSVMETKSNLTHHESGKVQSRSGLCQDHVGGHLQSEIADKEDGDGQRVLVRRKVEIVLHAGGFCVANATT